MKELNQALRVGKRIAAESENAALRPGIHFFDPGVAAEALDLHHVHQPAHFVRRVPEPVGEFSCEAIDIRTRFELRQAAVEIEPELEVADIRFRYERRRPDRDLGAPLIALAAYPNVRLKVTGTLLAMVGGAIGSRSRTTTSR